MTLKTQDHIAIESGLIVQDVVKLLDITKLDKTHMIFK